MIQSGKKKTKRFGKDQAQERVPKPVTERYLQNAAVFYLGRYSSSAANLGEVLKRKVRRRNEGHAPPSAEQEDMVAATVGKCVSLGLVNDTDYARAKARSLHSAGKSLRMIETALRHKGVEREDIEKALDALREERGDNLEQAAALAYARRRRFGPWRTRDGDEDKKRRELSSLARAGFSYRLASVIVDATSAEEIEDED